MTSAAERIAEAAAVRPSARQLAWQQVEFYGFIHFGINTMTGREWGEGHEDKQLFNPTDLDARQWVASLQSAGMRGLILTCKHHDGFCLWPSAMTSYSVAASPWRDGKGDLVAEVSAACAAQGMKFGIYLSPWDRTDASYGMGAAYDEFFVAQLRELLTGYGPIFSVWFDGANGEGRNGKIQPYDWDRYFSLVRELQPDAVICVCGPDVRWCGNEAGHVRQDEWSVVPASLRDAERTASRSQQVDDGEFARFVRSDDEDLGSRRAIIANTDPLVWYPAEVNTSIRPGWFYHPEEDVSVRTAQELFEIYVGSVGGNANLLLNVPPNASGVIAAPDLQVLAQLGRLISSLEQRDVTHVATVVSSNRALVGGGAWRPSPTESSPVLTLRWDAPLPIDGITLGEDIAFGQQIENVTITGALTIGSTHRPLASVRSVGHRRILSWPAALIQELSIRVGAWRGPVVLSEYSVRRAAKDPEN